MVSRFSCSVAVAILFAGLFSVTHCRVSIELSPSSHLRTSTDTVTVSCVPDPSDNRTKEVLLIELYNGHKQNLALVRQGGINVTYGQEDNPRLTASGHVSRDNPSSCFLNVTIAFPGMADSGTYTCDLYYLNQAGLVEEARASAILTADEPDVDGLNGVVRDLLQRVSSLEKEMATCGKCDADKAGTTTKSPQKMTTETPNHTIPTENFTTPQQETTTSLPPFGRKDLDILEERLDRLNESARDADKNNEYVKETMKYLQGEYDMLITAKAFPVPAFSAAANMASFFTVGDTVVFSKTLLLNQCQGCQGYDNTTGIYTAPDIGVYAFNVAFTTLAHDVKVDFFLLKNGKETLAVLYDVQPGVMASTGTVARLNPSDTVELKVQSITGGSQKKDAGKQIYLKRGDFSGFLIHRF